MWVRVAWEKDGVLLEVWDESPLLPAAPRLPGADAEDGRGNFVIEALTIRRGSTATEWLDGGGKVVWGIVPPAARRWLLAKTNRQPRTPRNNLGVLG